MFPKPSSSPSPSTSTASSLPSAVADLVRRMVGPAADSAAADLVARTCAEAVRAIAGGDVCLPLDRIAGLTPDDLLRQAAAADPETSPAFPDSDPAPAAPPAAAAFRFPSLPDLTAALLSFPAIVAPPDTPAFAPFILDRDRLYTRRNHRCERRIRDRLDTMARPHGAPQTDALCPPGSSTLFPEQLAALQTILSHPFAILTGGPGTGKTHVLARAVQLALRSDPSLRIRLAAPTGKAAARMAESLAAAGVVLPDSPTTLQHLIGQNPVTGGCRHDAANPLPADWLVIDEASMVDLLLFGHVLDALPSSARLLLIGDPHQLASVERGRILRDLCDSGRYPLARLATSHRFGADGPIALFAAAVNAGDAPAALSLLPEASSSPSSPLACTPHPADASRGPDAWPGFRAAVLAGFDALSRAATPADALSRIDAYRVLCAVRRGPFGVDRANAAIRAWLPPTAPMPVMVTHTDPPLDAHTGALGVILPAAPDLVCLPGAPPDPPPRSLPRLLLADLESAWATTIHKSQGSEYDDIAIVLPADPACPLLTREILYTAVTRTRRTARLWTSLPALRTCISRPVTRASGFA